MKLHSSVYLILIRKYYIQVTKTRNPHLNTEVRTHDGWIQGNYKLSSYKQTCNNQTIVNLHYTHLWDIRTRIDSLHTPSLRCPFRKGSISQFGPPVLVW